MTKSILIKAACIVSLLGLSVLSAAAAWGDHVSREPASVQLSRLIDAHTMILKYSRDKADKADDAGDSGTNDLLVSQVVRTNELQVWFLSEHLVAASPL